MFDVYVGFCPFVWRISFYANDCISVVRRGPPANPQHTQGTHVRMYPLLSLE
jgi:hypothetical protein